MTEATPRPWEFVMPGKIISHPDSAVIRHPGHFDWVGTVQVSNMPAWEANGELIVKAVNSHDALVEVVEAVEWSFQNGDSDCRLCGGMPTTGHEENCQLAAALAPLRAAR